MKDTVLVPKQLGWFGLERDGRDFPDPNDRYVVDWADNVNNYTEEQALFVCDVQSKESKEVESIMSDDDFLNWLDNTRRSTINIPS